MKGWPLEGWALRAGEQGAGRTVTWCRGASRVLGQEAVQAHGEVEHQLLQAEAAQGPPSPPATG